MIIIIYRIGLLLTGKQDVAEWADVPTNKPADDSEPEPNSTVYSDGSWRQTGKELGAGFAGIAKSMLHTVGIGTEEGAYTADSAGHHEPVDPVDPPQS